AARNRPTRLGRGAQTPEALVRVRRGRHVLLDRVGEAQVRLEPRLWPVGEGAADTRDGAQAVADTAEGVALPAEPAEREGRPERATVPGPGEVALGRGLRAHRLDELEVLGRPDRAPGAHVRGRVDPSGLDAPGVRVALPLERELRAEGARAGVAARLHVAELGGVGPGEAGRRGRLLGGEGRGAR